MAQKLKHGTKRQKATPQSASHGLIDVCFQTAKVKTRFKEKFATRTMKKTWVIDYAFFL